MSAPTPELPPRCEDCRWAFLEDYGYSNWTTEGTQVYCLKNLHPNGPQGFDAWFGEDERSFFAAKCPAFDGSDDPIHFDVDREDADAELEQAPVDVREAFAAWSLEASASSDPESTP